jgi:phosphocarrier protein HPr
MKNEGWNISILFAFYPSSLILHALLFMQQRRLMIRNPLGLHARAAARLVKLANGFQSEIRLARSDSPHRTVNAKSIFSVLILAATHGTMIEVLAEGRDETEAVEALCRMIEDRFGEIEN